MLPGSSRALATGLCLLLLLSTIPPSAVGGASSGTAVTDGVDAADGVDDTDASVGASDTGSALAETTAAPSLSVNQRTLGNVYRANETVRIGVATDAAGVRWTVHDYQGRRVANGTTSVDGERTLTLPLESVGHYTFRVETTTGAPRNATRTTIAVLPADDFDNEDAFYGMSTQFNAGWDRELMTVMDAVGVASVREDSGWAGIEQSRGSYDFSFPDGYMQPLGDLGFDRLFVLAYGNPLYAPDDGGYFSMPHTDAYRAAFANFSQASVAHYDDVDYVEVWNEPNLDGFATGPAGTDPAAYAALLDATYPAVHAERDDVTVVGGSATGNYTGTVETVDWSWWEGLFAAGGADAMDAMSIHLYRDEPTGFSEDLADLRALTREHNDGEALPIWVTELGWHTAPANPGGDAETTQARHLVQSHARLQAAGVERYDWYTFRDTTFEGEDNPQTAAGNSQFGLLRSPTNPQGPQTPKPGLVAYAVMTRQVAGMDVVGERAGPVERYTFANGTERTHVLWNETRTDVTVHTDEPVTVTTMTGDRTTLRPQDGAVALTVGPDPLYLDGAVTNVTRGAPVSVAAPVSSGGDAAPLTVSVTGDEEARTDTHRVADRTATVTAGADETATTTLGVPAAYRDRAATAVDVVSVDGDPFARLTTPVGVPGARLGDPAAFSGLTVETWNDSAGWMTEANDVGTRYSDFTVRTREGRQCWESDVSAGRPGSALFVDVADSHAAALEDPVHVTVTYVADGESEVVAQYDGPGDDADWGGTLTTDGGGTWREHTFELTDTQFANGLGPQHDFRLMIAQDAADVCIGSVTVGTDPVDPLPAPDESNDSAEDGDGESGSTPDGDPESATDSADDTETSGPDEAPGDGTPSTVTTTSAGDATTGSGPGYGVLVAVVALVVVAVRWRREQR